MRYESRSEQDIPLETLNLTEKDRFMRGEKDVAIISEAASSGISLQVSLVLTFLGGYYNVSSSVYAMAKITN